MILETFPGVWSNRRGTGIHPQVRAMAASLAKRNVVDVWGGALLEKRQQLMLGSVETAHAGVRFGPDDQIERRQTESRCGGVSDGQATLIDKRAQDSTIDEMWKNGIHPVLVKIEELWIRHFSGSHDEFPMLAPGHVPPDRDIEGFICEDHAGDICVHEPLDNGRIGSVAADEAMGPEQEQIAHPSDRSGAGQGREIADFASIVVGADYELIDLVRTEPRNLDWRVSDTQMGIREGLQDGRGARLHSDAWQRGKADREDLVGRHQELSGIVSSTISLIKIKSWKRWLSRK
jgi:hypothetical protein